MIKHWLYLSYVLRHKWFVMLACFRRGLIWQGIFHDLSKFTPGEWIPYANFFYGPRSKTRTQTEGERVAFDTAWLRHQHRNPHHWQHWVLREDNGGTKTLPMPLRYIKEMLADWEGAGRAITGKVEYVSWYMKNRSNILLHPDTERQVHLMLGVRIVDIAKP